MRRSNCCGAISFGAAKACVLFKWSHANLWLTPHGVFADKLHKDK
jgi:hypothetical protein